MVNNRVKDVLESVATWSKEEKELLLKKDSVITKELIAIEQRLIARKSLLGEIKQAKVAGKSALRILEKIDKQLREVFDWGKQPTHNKSKKPKSRPRRWVNRATQNAYKAKSQLQKFETELLDLSTHYDLSYKEEIASIHLFLNLFVDNLIVDWVIQKKINHTLYGVSSVHDRISMILLLLDNEVAEVKKMMRQIQSERKQLLVNSSIKK